MTTDDAWRVDVTGTVDRLRGEHMRIVLHTPIDDVLWLPAYPGAVEDDEIEIAIVVRRRTT